MKPLSISFILSLSALASAQDTAPPTLATQFEALEALDPTARDQAAQSITLAGAAAIPRLDAHLRDPGTSQRTLWYLWRIVRDLGEQAAPLRATIEDFVATDRSNQARRAADVLARLDRAGAAFLAARVKDLSMPAQTAFNALESAAAAGGEAAVEQLVLLTASAETQVAAMADRRLSSLPARASPVGLARGWAALLTRPEHVAKAARELGSLGPHAAPFADELLAALDSSADPTTDVWLATALGKSGATARIASALDAAAPRQRRALAHGLGFAGKRAVAPLMTLANDADEQVRWRAIGALQRIGSDAVPALAAALADASRTTFAIEVLTRIGPAARAAIAPLRALAARDPSRRTAVERALGVIEE